MGTREKEEMQECVVFTTDSFKPEIPNNPIRKKKWGKGKLQMKLTLSKTQGLFLLRDLSVNLLRHYV